MNEEQVREIARTVFNAYFGDINVICVNVKRGFDHCDDPKTQPRCMDERRAGARDRGDRIQGSIP